MPDHSSAANEHDSRRVLLGAGADRLPRAPWLHDAQPPSSVDLVRFAVWRGQSDEITDEEVDAGLGLLSAARAEVEQLETALLFVARSRGVSWGQIGRAMGLGSAQAATQRFDRLASRVESRGQA